MLTEGINGSHTWWRCLLFQALKLTKPYFILVKNKKNTEVHVWYQASIWPYRTDQFRGTVSLYSAGSLGAACVFHPEKYFHRFPRWRVNISWCSVTISLLPEHGIILFLQSKYTQRLHNSRLRVSVHALILIFFRQLLCVPMKSYFPIYQLALVNFCCNIFFIQISWQWGMPYFEKGGERVPKNWWQNRGKKLEDN